MDETRVFPNGDTITREQAESQGTSWGLVCLYTEPVTDQSQLTEKGTTDE